MFPHCIKQKIQCFFFNNYRPISLLSVFSKILERIMYSRFLKFINKNNLLNKFQFGFGNNHPTFMALIVLMENLITALDNGNCDIGLFLDFQEAFDTVDHHILLDKLHFYGVRATAHDWFTSYLSNRLQLVNYNGYESDFRVMKCGVPQGSILGPLILLIYISDLPAVSKYFMPILFCRWHYFFFFLHWPESERYCLSNKPGNQNDLFVG